MPTTRELDEAHLEAVAPGYLQRVRQAATRIGRRDVGADRVAAALSALGDAAEIDTDVPTRSRRRPVAALKQAVKKLIGWYLRYLGGQVTTLGRAVETLGTALAADLDRHDAELAELRRDVAGLRARLDRMEPGGDQP